jgi:hypothetical protein
MATLQSIRCRADEAGDRTPALCEEASPKPKVDEEEVFLDGLTQSRGKGNP